MDASHYLPNQQRSDSLRLLMTAEVDDAGASRRPGAMKCAPWWFAGIAGAAMGAMWNYVASSAIT